MEFTLHEAVPEISNSKTELGRVVVNPPSMIGPLITKPTGKFFMCCSRAFLTEESYFNHLEEKGTHGKAIDFSKLPRPPWYKEPCLDGSNFKMWYVRKHGCALKSKLEAEAKDLAEAEDTEKNAETNRNGIVNDKRIRKRCPLCNFMVLYGNIKRHIKNCHVEDGIKCIYCSCAFLLRRSLIRHQRTVHGVQKHNQPTNKIQKTIVARAKKQLVLKTVRNGRSAHDCAVCGKDFFNAMRLRDHMNSHTGARPYKCEKCGYRFSHASNLHRHMKKAHTKNDKFFCSTCKCSFANNFLLKRHIRAMHPVKLKIKKLNSPEPKMHKRETPSASPLSKKEEQLPSVLQTPTKDSSGLYECTVCHKKLTTTQTLRGHMLIHQNLKPYKCKFCGISFRLLSTVSQHIASAHSGGSFKCKQCSCRFKVLKALLRHVKVIHPVLKEENKKIISNSNKIIEDNIESKKESPKKSVAGFKCNLCGRMVKTIAEFNAHKILHNGSKRSQCNLCLKSFGSGVNVRIHKTRAHGDDAVHIYKCTFCCCRYKASQALYSHLVKEHQMKREDWNFTQKTIKPEACKRIQWSLCDFESNQDSSSAVVNNDKSQVNESKVTNNVGKSEGGEDQKSNKPFECDICHLRFKTRKNITKHKKIAHNHGSYVCGLCPCRYHKLTWLEKHQLKVHGHLKLPEPEEKTNPSEVKSRQVLKSLPQLAKHEISRAKKFECQICKLRFVTLFSRFKHQQRSHFHSGKFKCSECPCKFLGFKGLELHRSIYHGYIGKRRLARNAMNGHVDSEKSESNSSMTSEADFEIGSSQSLKDEAPKSFNTKTYECDLCHIKFSQSGILRNHKLKSHFHSGKFKCSKCSCKFLSSHGLINHMKLHSKHHRNTVYRRKGEKIDEKVEKVAAETTLPNETTENEDLPTKTTTLSVSAKYKCDLCGLMVAQGLWSHKKTSHGSGSHSCSDCSCTFETPQGLTRHRVVYHNSKHENRVETTESNLNEDSNIESEETSSPVSKVNRNFLKIRGSFSPKKLKSKSSVGQILNSPSRETKVNGAIYPTNTPRVASSSPHYKFKCDQCGIRLTHNAYLKRHLRMAHTIGGVECNLCPCTFISGGALAAHKRVYHSPSHAERLPIVKKILRKSVKSKLTFDRKVAVDGVVKSKQPEARRNSASDSNSTVPSSLKENEVNKNLQSSSAKRKRTTMNSNTVPEISPETSSEAQKLSESKLDESDSLKSLSKELQQCKFCSKAFCNIRLLNKHMLCHTKPEKCPKCGMAFRNKDEVSRHIKMAHDESCVHQCFICSCRFSTETGLRRHQGLMHKDQPKINEDNIVIEEDDGAVSDSEPFLQVESTYSQQNVDENGFCEESVPIVQGILEANYLPNGDVVYTNGIGDQMTYPVAPESPEYIMHQDIQEFEEEEPVFHSVVEYEDSEVVYREVLPSPSPPTKLSPVAKKKTFSPKLRPIKCSECDVMCQGPENLRLHMESQHKGQEQLEESDDFAIDEESAGEPEPMQASSKGIEQVKMIGCEKCSYEFATKNELMQHLESEHDESGLYRCAYCPCTMKTEINLRYHFMKYHSG